MTTLKPVTAKWKQKNCQWWPVNMTILQECNLAVNSEPRWQAIGHYSMSYILQLALAERNIQLQTTNKQCVTKMRVFWHKIEDIIFICEIRLQITFSTSFCNDLQLSITLSNTQSSLEETILHSHLWECVCVHTHKHTEGHVHTYTQIVSWLMTMGETFQSTKFHDTNYYRGL